MGCGREAAGRKTSQEATAVILMGDDVARSRAGEDEGTDLRGVRKDTLLDMVTNWM